MAGRGRGRGGKSSMSFDVGRLGFGSGEALPKANVQPPALYPVSYIQILLFALHIFLKFSIELHRFEIKP